MFRLIPKEMVFFDLFEKAARNVHDGALAVARLFEDYTDLPTKAARLKDIEHAGDELTHETIHLLNKTFVTPIDREDIHELVCRLDDVLDLLDTAVDRMVLYRIEAPTEDAKSLARVTVEATRLITELVPELRDLKKPDALVRKCIEVHALEKEGDRLERHGLALLFDTVKDPVQIIRWKDVYEDLEAATDRCEDVANVIEGIILKNA